MNSLNQTTTGELAGPASTPSTFSVAHFGFRRKPFQGIGIDFLRAYRDYDDAYAQLLDAIRAYRELILLVGEAGTGKTSLLNNLAKDPTVGLSCIFCTAPADFDAALSTICTELALTAGGPERPHKLKVVKEYMDSSRGADETMVLIIDDAHEVSASTIRDVLHLIQPSNRKDGCSISIVLAGNALLEKELHQSNLGGHVVQDAVVIRLQILNNLQSAAFVRQQLQLAGGEGDAVFSKGAMQYIIAYGQGVPQHLNALCNLSLALAEHRGRTSVSIELVEQAASELRLDISKPVSPSSRLAQTPTLSGSDTGVQANPQRNRDTNLQHVGAGHDSGESLPKRLLLAGLLLLITAGGAGAFLLYTSQEQALSESIQPPAGADLPTATSPQASLPAPAAAPPGQAPAAVESSTAVTLPALPEPAPPTDAAAAPPPVATITAPPEDTPEATPAAKAAEHIRQGHQMLDLGDVAAARLAYEAAARLGNSKAATAVGKTYDPVALKQSGLHNSFYSDALKAAQWYLKASAVGDIEARDRLNGLRRSLDKNSLALGESEARELHQLLRRHGF